MKKILAIIVKNLKLRFTSPAEWLFFLILPVIFTVVLAGGTGDPGDSRVGLLVVDQANTPLSQRVIAALEQSGVVRLDLHPLEEAEDLFDSRAAPALLVIPADFDQAALQDGRARLILHEQPNNTGALVASQAVSAAVRRVSGVYQIAGQAAGAAERIRPFESAAAREEFFDAALRAAEAEIETAPAYVTVRQGATQDEIDYDPRAASSAGQLITWVFVPLLAISGTFAYERQKGTLRRLLVTPTARSTFMIGTIAGEVLAALVQMLLLVTFGMLVMKLNWGHDPLALALILVTTALAGAALGTTLGAFVKTERQAGGLSLLFGMVMALLGGCWYPIELFPPAVQDAVRVLPTRWAMQGMLNLVQRGQGVEGVLLESLVLLGFAVLFFAVGVARFRYE